MNDVERIIELEKIKLVKARYCRCIDEKDLENFFALFAEDLVFDLQTDRPEDPTLADTDFGNTGLSSGKAKFIAWVRETIANVEASAHHCHMPEIEFTSDTTARAVWAMEDQLFFIDSMPMSSLHGLGHYRETYEKINGNWLIKTLQLTRLKVTVVPRASDG